MLRSGSRVKARTSSKPWMAASAGMSGLSATSGLSGVSTARSSSPRPSGSSNRSESTLAPGLCSFPGEPVGPEVERGAVRDAEDDAVHHAGPGAAAAGARILEERDVRAGRAFLVGVEEVVDRRVVLVDGLLHEPQPEDARVEVDVSAGRRR